VIAKQVAIGALKFSILKQASGKDIIFDFEKSVSFEGDSGPYLQYATVRANSILKKSEMSKATFDTKMPENWQTTDLERMLERFESVVNRAGAEYAPHYIVTYLIQLAGEFNSFYAKHKIIDEKDIASPYKLALTKSFANIMTSGLDLLGIKVPEEM
jgi:arginyl-tRNA synthetase